MRVDPIDTFSGTLASTPLRIALIWFFVATSVIVSSSFREGIPSSQECLLGALWPLYLLVWTIDHDLLTVLCSTALYTFLIVEAFKFIFGDYSINQLIYVITSSYLITMLHQDAFGFARLGQLVFAALLVGCSLVVYFRERRFKNYQDA